MLGEKENIHILNPAVKQRGLFVEDNKLYAQTLYCKICKPQICSSHVNFYVNENVCIHFLNLLYSRLGSQRPVYQCTSWTILNSSPDPCRTVTEHPTLKRFLYILHRFFWGTIRFSFLSSESFF